MLKIGEVYTEMCIQITAMALVPQQYYHGYRIVCRSYLFFAAATSLRIRSCSRAGVSVQVQ